MSKKRIRARTMFAAPEHGNSHQMWFTLSSKRDDKIFCDFTRPVYVLPATAEAYEQMVEQMAKALRKADLLYEEWDAPTSLYYKSLSHAALHAIGIKPPKKGRT